MNQMHNRESYFNCHVLHISMCDNLQYVGPLDDNQPPHEIAINYLNTKHYGIEISKFNFIRFLSTTNEIFWQISFQVSTELKKQISCIQAVCEMDMAYPWNKKQKNFASMCGYKNRRSFPLRTVLRIEILWKVQFSWNMK